MLRFEYSSHPLVPCTTGCSRWRRLDGNPIGVHRHGAPSRRRYLRGNYSWLPTSGCLHCPSECELLPRRTPREQPLLYRITIHRLEPGASMPVLANDRSELPVELKLAIGHHPITAEVSTSFVWRGASAISNNTRANTAMATLTIPAVAQFSKLCTNPVSCPKPEGCACPPAAAVAALLPVVETGSPASTLNGLSVE